MAVVFWIVKSVVCAVVAGDWKSTSKYGRSSVAAGRAAMSQGASLFVVTGPAGRAEVEKNKAASVPRQRIAGEPPRAVRTRAPRRRYFSFSAASTSSACRAVSTFFQILLIRPSAPIQYVVRATPQLRRP